MAERKAEQREEAHAIVRMCAHRWKPEDLMPTKVCNWPENDPLHWGRSTLTHAFVAPTESEPEREWKVGDWPDERSEVLAHGDSLAGLEAAAWSWEPEVRLLGNVRAQTIRELCAELRAYRDPVPTHYATDSTAMDHERAKQPSPEMWRTLNEIREQSAADIASRRDAEASMCAETPSPEVGMVEEAFEAWLRLPPQSGYWLNDDDWKKLEQAWKAGFRFAKEQSK